MSEKLMRDVRFLILAFIWWFSEQAWQFKSYFCTLKACGFSSTQTRLSGSDVQRERKDFMNLLYLKKCDIQPTL